MIKNNIKAYKIFIKKEGSTATILCVTYGIDNIDRYFGAEFYILVNSFDNSSFSIPSNRTATFQEEVRATGKGFGVAPEYSTGIEDWIQFKIKDAYGNDLDLKFEKLN
jgi:hypothetical protein